MTAPNLDRAHRPGPGWGTGAGSQTDGPALTHARAKDGRPPAAGRIQAVRSAGRKMIFYAAGT